MAAIRRCAVAVDRRDPDHRRVAHRGRGEVAQRVVVRALARVAAEAEALGGEAVGSTPAEFRQLIAREIPRWRKLIKELGMTGTLN